MTCRNYIPGPNGDDVRALLEQLDRLPVDVRVYDGYRTVEVPSSLFDKAVEALRAILNGDCQRCVEIRAGHAGSEKRMTDDPRKLREQIGYLIGMLQVRGDPRSLPEILDEVERATKDK